MRGRKSGQRVSDSHMEGVRSIEKTLSVLASVVGERRTPSPGVSDPAVLLETCLARLEEDGAALSRPIRTIHHLSCTGGTLFAKCIAAMPNILLLNEVDPLSTLLLQEGKPAFAPTDMISLVRQGDPELTSDVLVRMFAKDIEFLAHDQARIGRDIVLRDHSHSHFLIGATIAERPTLREMVADVSAVNSVVTVRDPIDSYLSMVANGWQLQFSPSTFDEYCRRYQAFLDRYEGIDIIRYEDLVDDPKSTMHRICTILDLTYSDDFVDLFSAFTLSGDSGRSGSAIGKRSRRESAAQLADMTRNSNNYTKLAQSLGYAIV